MTSAPPSAPNVCSSCGCFRNLPITNPGDLCAECRKRLAPLQFQAFYLCRALCGDMDEHSIAIRVPLMMQAYVLGARHQPDEVVIDVPHLWSEIPTVSAAPGLAHTWYCLCCGKQTTTDSAQAPDALAGECCQQLPVADVAVGWAQANHRIGELSQMLFDVCRNHAIQDSPSQDSVKPITPHGRRHIADGQLTETLALALSNQKLRADLQAASMRIDELQKRSPAANSSRPPTAEGGKLIFVAGRNYYEDGDGEQPAMLELCPNGDIFVNGRLAANDKEVVDTLREFTTRLDTGLRDELARLVEAAELDADSSDAVSVDDLRQLLDGHASRAAERVKQTALAVLDEVHDRLLLNSQVTRPLEVVQIFRDDIRDGNFVATTVARSAPASGAS